MKKNGDTISICIFWVSVDLLIVLSTKGLWSSRVQGELDGMFCGTQLSGTSADSVPLLAAAHTRVWILLWLQFQQKFISNGPGGATLNVSSFKWLFRLPLLVLPINWGYKDQSLWFPCTDTGTERTRAVPKSCSIPGRHHMSPPLQRIPGLRPPLRSNLAKEPGCPCAVVRSSTSLHCGTLFRFPLPCLHLCGCPKALQTPRVCKPRKSACTEERWGTNAAFAITSLSFH